MMEKKSSIVEQNVSVNFFFNLSSPFILVSRVSLDLISDYKEEINYAYV